MIELSKYVLEALRKDKEFILYRGRSKDEHLRFLCFRLRWSIPRRKPWNGWSTNILLEKSWIPVGLPDRSQLLASGIGRYWC